MLKATDKGQRTVKTYKSAFTLVEVLIAVGILGLTVFSIIGVIMPMMANSVDIRKKKDRIEAISTLGRIIEESPYEGIANLVQKQKTLFAYLGPQPFITNSVKELFNANIDRDEGSPLYKINFNGSRLKTPREAAIPFVIEMSCIDTDLAKSGIIREKGSLLEYTAVKNR